jgi:GTP 3',8-cyclase
LDSLDDDKFSQITRGGVLKDVLSGIETAQTHGIAIKINMVALRGTNEADLIPIASYCASNGHSLALIETMPLGNNIGRRKDEYISLDQFIQPLLAHNELHPSAHRSAGPARYFELHPLGLRIGMITPMSDNFCTNCNRLRLTTDGKIYMCLGSDLHVDFKTAIREQGIMAVDKLLQSALRLKPERHDFEKQLANPSARIARNMNMTGG